MQRCFPQAEKPDIAVAVSGGADSMALLLLASDWASARGGVVTAITVDHGLRKESAYEAAQVGESCASYGIKHHTLNFPSPLAGEGQGGGDVNDKWHTPSPYPLPQGEEVLKVTQETARNARYQLLAQWCTDHQTPYLLTAHHRDDQAETLFFRLARGSGLDGLACMRPAVMRDGITLLRPLLPIAKARLIATLEARGQEWIEDPSNQSPNYTRNRIRALIDATGNADSICERAYAISERLGAFRSALERKTQAKIDECVTYKEDGSAALDCAAFLALEPEYGLRVITALVIKIGQGEYKPRTEKLERFYAQLCKDIQAGSAKKRSFAHCMFTPYLKKGFIIVRAEIKHNATCA